MSRNLFAIMLSLFAITKCRLGGGTRPPESHARILRFPIEKIPALFSLRIPQVQMFAGQLSSVLFMLKVHQTTAAPKNKHKQADQGRKSSRSGRGAGTKSVPVLLEPDIPEEQVDGTTQPSGSLSAEGTATSRMLT